MKKKMNKKESAAYLDEVFRKSEELDKAWLPWSVTGVLSVVGFAGSIYGIFVISARPQTASRSPLLAAAVVGAIITVLIFLLVCMKLYGTVRTLQAMFPVVFEEPKTPPKVNTKNPPPPDESEVWKAQVVTYGTCFLSAYTLLLALLVRSNGNSLWIPLFLFCPIFMLLARVGFGRLKDLNEPIPLVSWLSEFNVQGHAIQIAFQMPEVCNTPQVQERIKITSTVVLRNAKQGAFQEALEEGLASDVSELKIPVFRIQIIAVDHVTTPTVTPEASVRVLKKMDQTGVRVNTTNPPHPDEFVQQYKIAALYTLAGLTGIALMLGVWFRTDGALMSACLVLAVIFGFGARSHYLGLKKLREPLPLTSWTHAFRLGIDSAEIAFQLPAGYDTPSVRERIQIAAKAILRSVNEAELQDALEQGLAKDVSELKIPVFRIHVLAVSKVASAAVKVEPGIYL